MTREEFNSMKFKVGMKVEYNSKPFDIISVDFEEGLIGINETNEEDDISWKRCENCKIVYV